MAKVPIKVHLDQSLKPPRPLHGHKSSLKVSKTRWRCAHIGIRTLTKSKARARPVAGGGGRFVTLLGAVCYPFGISAYQVCISYVSAVYQCRRTFAFLIRLYQGVSGMCFICISSVSVTWVPPTLIRCIRVYQECIRHVSGVYQEGCSFTR